MSKHHTAGVLDQQIRARLRNAPTYLAGGDFGNSTAILALKALGEPAQVSGSPFIIPSSVGRGDIQQLLVTRSGAAGAQGSLIADGSFLELAVEYGGTTYYVGDLAVTQARNATTARGNDARYYDGHTLTLFLTLVAHATDGDARVKLVTGVPPKLLREQPQIKQQIFESFVGTHHLLFHSARGTRSVIIEVVSVATLIEGLAPLLVYGELGRPLGLIDIGGHTVDICWVDAQGRIIDHRVASLRDSGTEQIGQRLSDMFKSQYGRSLTTAEREDALRAYVRDEEISVYHRGERKIPRDWIRLAISQVATPINNFLATWWGVEGTSAVASDGAYVLEVGGGAYYFDNTNLKLDTELRPVEHPEIANASSYLVMAERIETRESWPKVEAVRGME